MKRPMLIFGMLIFLFSFLYSADKSQWRGPYRNGVYPEKNLLKKWPENGPKLLWEIEDLGQGHSTVAVANQKLYITEMVNGTGYLRAYNLTGKLLWKKTYGKEWDKSYEGARSTPSVVDGRVYIMSAFGKVSCFDAEKGSTIWSVDLQKTFGARNIGWGMTENLLIDGDKVICTPGGSEVTMVALNRLTGKTIWKSKTNGQKSGYCSPIVFEHGGKRIIVTMLASSVIAVNAENGRYLWQHQHITEWDVNPNIPIYKDGYVYCLSGYGTGGEKLELSADGKSVKQVWRNKTLDSQIGAAVLVDKYIYGSGHSNRGWQCLDWNTGEVKYRSRELGGKGNIIYADGMLYVYNESGYVGLVKPDPTGFSVVSSFKITKGSAAHWAHLVIAEGRLYVRHGNALMVYSIAK